LLNLNDLYLFVQVVDSRGFAPAARRLGMPKSTLSKRIAQLEQELGVTLVHRTSRSFTVTDIGADFYRHAAAMLIEAEAAEDVVKGRLAEPAGTVRITASIPSVQLTLADLLPDLALKYPKIQLVVHATDRFVDIVQEGFDIALRAHFAPLPDSDLVQRRLSVEPIYLVAAPGYLEQRGVPQHPTELTEHDGLPVSRTLPPWRLTSDAGEVVEVYAKPRLIADESVTLLRAAEAGLGIACLPRHLCRSALGAGRLAHVLTGWTAGSVTTTLLMPRRRGDLPAVRAVVNFLVERYRE
jgi:DNA-binding transcriptional LysR family regulator